MSEWVNELVSQSVSQLVGENAWYNWRCTWELTHIYVSPFTRYVKRMRYIANYDPATRTRWNSTQHDLLQNCCQYTVGEGGGRERGWSVCCTDGGEATAHSRFFCRLFKNLKSRDNNHAQSSEQSFGHFLICLSKVTKQTSLQSHSIYNPTKIGQLMPAAPVT